MFGNLFRKNSVQGVTNSSNFIGMLETVRDPSSVKLLQNFTF